MQQQIAHKCKVHRVLAGELSWELLRWLMTTVSRDVNGRKLLEYTKIYTFLIVRLRALLLYYHVALAVKQEHCGSKKRENDAPRTGIQLKVVNIYVCGVLPAYDRSSVQSRKWPVRINRLVELGL
jgi:hypothetical protein